MSRQAPLIFVVSGEASGDNLAGRLMAALKAQTDGRVRFAGVGGPQSEAHGLKSLFPMRELSVIGLAEVLPHLPRLIKRLNQTVAAARELKPDVIVTVDSPGFCLRLAHHLRGSGIPVVHYVAPQLWAWRAGRARKLAKRVDHLMALLPFEVPFFANYGIPCTYVGHSAIESGASSGDGPAFRRRHDLPADVPLLCVVPGSRAGEVRRILPVFGEALRLLKEAHPELRVVIPVAAPVADEVDALTKDWPLPVIQVADADERFDAFAACNAAMTKSGTVTLELALAQVPMVVAYRVSAATAFLVRRMGVNVEYASLVNLLVGHAVVPELLQENCTPDRLATAVDELLRSKDARDAQREGFREVVKILGEATPPPSQRAAKVVLDAIRVRAALEPLER
ncbi:MAG: lipid-A-disaccharide synthase [Methyloceanibacter sp.]|uniref:lipid-A-disaccharide synthase n=1 Tax=Methyloceanibacter sp. TaxID=1965321 RepID=UPI003D6CE4FB